LTLHDYLRIVRRRKWIIIMATLLAPLVAVLLTRSEPITYEASAQVLVSRQNLAANLAGVNDPTQLDSTRTLTTQAQFARLPVIAQRTLAAAGIENASASDLLGESRVTSADDSDLLTFTVANRHPALATDLASEYARQYVSYRDEFEREQLATARDSITERIHQLKEAGATNSPLYVSLVKQADALATMEAVDSPRAALVRPATSAGRLEPPVLRNGVLALVIGFMTGLGLAFLRDALDARPRSAGEIGSRLDLRLLGRLPEPPRALKRANGLVMLADPESPSAEAFRMLRMSLEFATSRRIVRRGSSEFPVAARSGDRHIGRLMVTSAVEGEGKSTTVANLAVAFAEAGRRVFLVDLDFGRGSIHRFFGLPSQPGVTDVALGSVPLETVVSYVDMDVAARIERSTRPHSERRTGSLGVVPLGTMPAHADDVGGTAAIEQVLERLESEADLVLVDSPPLLRVGDALALTTHVDALLLVANLRAVRPTMLDELRRLLADCPVPKLGFVLTGANLEEGHEYLTYHYRRAVDAG
jgi:Mrp family chromosome partitioning ATPase/capsular polysaccharide biosynthesis protein